MSAPTPKDQETPSAKVFSVTELLEKILLHCRPLTLFALKRVNTTFFDIITDRKEIKQRMLLEPEATPRLRLFNLVTTLQSQHLNRAISPIRIEGVHTLTHDHDYGNKLIIRVEVRPPHFTRTPPIVTNSPYKQGGSWEGIKVEHPGLQLEVVMGRKIVGKYPPEQVAELREILSACELF